MCVCQLEGAVCTCIHTLHTHNARTIGVVVSWEIKRELYFKGLFGLIFASFGAREEGERNPFPSIESFFEQAGA